MDLHACVWLYVSVNDLSVGFWLPVAQQFTVINFYVTLGGFALFKKQQLTLAHARW